MGHTFFPGGLPRTRRWREVIALFHGGAGVAQLANATIRTITDSLLHSSRDPGVIETIWILMRMPLAAREDDFPAALRRCGLDVEDSPSFYDITCAMSDAIDRAMNTKRRTDVGEMAQLAASEAITSIVGERHASLFETSTDDVKRAFAESATTKHFGHLARVFFAKFTHRCLAAILSREWQSATGPNRRFTTPSGLSTFTRALETHCYQAALIVETYASEWRNLHNALSLGTFGRDNVRKFTSYAMTKMIKELKTGADLHA